MRVQAPTRTTRRAFVGGGVATLASVLTAASASAQGRSSTPPTSDVPDTLTVTHEFGTVTFPARPTRVVALENRRDLETATVLGLPLIAVGTYGDPADVVAPFVPIDLGDAEILDLTELNIELLLSLEPDLILAREIYLDDGRLFDVAPVLPIAGDGSWRDDLELVAGWMQRETTLGSALDQYDTMRSDVSTVRADALATARIAIVEYYPADGTFYAGGIDDFQLQANTLGELGGQLIDFLADRSYFDEPFSIESLGELGAADAILLVTSAEADRSALEEHELWQQLPAVGAGRVVATDTRTNQGSVYAATESLRLLGELYGTID